MSLRIEKIFSMMSLAALGFLAISCVPNVKDAPVNPPVNVSAEISPEIPAEISIDLEVDAVREVEMMNAQRSVHSGPSFHTD